MLSQCGMQKTSSKINKNKGREACLTRWSWGADLGMRESLHGVKCATAFEALSCLSRVLTDNLLSSVKRKGHQ